MTARLHFRGPARYRLRSAANLSQSVLEVSTRRALKGPRLPSWSWYVEVATEVAKRRTLTAFQLSDVKEARRYLDSVVIRSRELSAVNITPVLQDKFRGSWFVSKKPEPRVTVLYFHGGGYSFYPQAYAHFIALITLARNLEPSRLITGSHRNIGFRRNLKTRSTPTAGCWSRAPIRLV
jgi:epsilon-lactone hydrolase